MFRTDLLSIIRNLNTVFTAIGICHISYIDCLLAVFRKSWHEHVHLLIRLHGGVIQKTITWIFSVVNMSIKKFVYFQLRYPIKSSRKEDPERRWYTQSVCTYLRK